jgi:hypothetical protein
LFAFYFLSLDPLSLSKKNGPIKPHIRIEGMQKSASARACLRTCEKKAARTTPGSLNLQSRLRFTSR